MGLIEGFAPVYSTGASAKTFAASGQKIHVSSLVVANTDGSNPDTVTFTDGDGTTILVVNLAANETKVIAGSGAPLLFNNGLISTASAATIHITSFQR